MFRVHHYIYVELIFIIKFLLLVCIIRTGDNEVDSAFISACTVPHSGGTFRLGWNRREKAERKEGVVENKRGGGKGEIGWGRKGERE